MPNVFYTLYTNIEGGRQIFTSCLLLQTENTFSASEAKDLSWQSVHITNLPLFFQLNQLRHIKLPKEILLLNSFYHV